MKNKLTVLVLLIFVLASINYAQVPISPANAATVIDANVAVSWTAFGTFAYDYEVVINGALTGVPTVSNTALLTFAIPGTSLSNGDVVNWQVRDYNGGTPLAWNVYSFTIGPPTPTPADAAINQVLNTAAVSWTAFDEGGFGDGPYDVELADASFAGAHSTVAFATNTAATTLAIPTLLIPSHTYYWRVRDTDTDGAFTDGAWQTFSFSTIQVPTTQAHTLILLMLAQRNSM